MSVGKGGEGAGSRSGAAPEPRFAAGATPPERDPDAAGAPQQDKLGRASFLKVISGVGGAVTALGAGVPAGLAFLSPVLRSKPSENWVDLGEAEFFDWEVPIRIDIPQTVQDAWVETRVMRSVWIYTEDGEEFTIWSGRCTHLGCGFHHDEDEDVYACPCHRGVFDVRTGEVLAGPPPRSLDALEAKVEDGILRVRYQDFRPGIPEKVAL